MQKAVSKILLVDADGVHAEAALEVLAACSVDISRLTEGDEALEYLFGSTAGTGLPDLVILHLGRPRQSVMEIVERMRIETATAKIPIFILVDSTEEKQAFERLNFKLCSCTVRPLTFGKLVYALPALGMTINESVLYTSAENGTNLAYR